MTKKDEKECPYCFDGVMEWEVGNPMVGDTGWMCRSCNFFEYEKV